MRSTNFLIGAFLACGLSLFAPAFISAAPLSELLPRKGVGIDGMGFASIILAVIDYLKGSNAYDPDVPDKCVINMFTTSGGYCQTNIQCDETDEPGRDLPWQVCYVGGRQFFTDPHIGDFSITFSKAGGVNGDTQDGLHTPILQLAAVGNWDPLDVEATAQRAIGNDAGNLCAFNNGGAGTQQLGWVCGVPTLGKSGFGLDSNTAVQSTGFAPGWCTAHVTQYQRNENGIGADYAFDVLMFDANQTPIGQVTKAPIDPATKTLNVDSNLPLVLVITADGGDADAVKFAYGGQNWNSKDNTNLGAGPADGYEDGKRQGDMGWTC